MKLKVGKVFWSYVVYEGSIWSEWVVRSIRKNNRSWLGTGYSHPHKAYIVEKTDFTWVKLSKANGNWGWAKNIPSFCRHTARSEDGLDYDIPPSIHSTKMQAVQAYIKMRSKWLKEAIAEARVCGLDSGTKVYAAEDQEEIDELEKDLKTARRMLGRLKKAK